MVKVPALRKWKGEVKETALESAKQMVEEIVARSLVKESLYPSATPPITAEVRDMNSFWTELVQEPERLRSDPTYLESLGVSRTPSIH